MREIKFSVSGIRWWNCIVFYCPYLYSIHEKANYIAIFWTGRPHSLGSWEVICLKYFQLFCRTYAKKVFLEEE